MKGKTVKNWKDFKDENGYVLVNPSDKFTTGSYGEMFERFKFMRDLGPAAKGDFLRYFCVSFYHLNFIVNFSEAFLTKNSHPRRRISSQSLPTSTKPKLNHSKGCKTVQPHLKIKSKTSTKSSTSVHKKKVSFDVNKAKENYKILKKEKLLRKKNQKKRQSNQGCFSWLRKKDEPVWKQKAPKEMVQMIKQYEEKGAKKRKAVEFSKNT